MSVTVVHLETHQIRLGNVIHVIFVAPNTVTDSHRNHDIKYEIATYPVASGNFIFDVVIQVQPTIYCTRLTFTYDYE